MSPEDFQLTIIVAFISVAASAVIALLITWQYYKKAMKETNKRLATLESLGVLNVKLQQAPDPSKLEHEKRKQDDLYVTKGRITMTTDAYLVRERPKYPVWHDDGTYAKV